MSVINGQQANAATFNAAFLSRLTDSDTIAIIDLLNVAAGSGGSITNIQRELNKLNSFLGSASNTAFDTIPVFTHNFVGSGTDSIYDRSDAHTERFHATTGHTHNGTPGEGPAVSSTNLSDFNDFWAFLLTTTFNTAVGLSSNVTSAFSAFTPGGDVATEGVVTAVPYNRVGLRSKLSGDKVEKPTGELIYGRLTESTGTWTLTYFYTDSSGVEQAYSLPSQDLRLYFREVSRSATRPTFSQDAELIDSLDLTTDIVDATATQAGKVNTTTQAFGGIKTFQDGAQIRQFSLEKSDQASGGILTALSSTYSYVRLTGVSTTEIQGIVATTRATRLLIYNDSTGDLTLKNQNAGATAINRIITTDGNDLTISENQSVELIYDLSTARWVVISTAGGGSGQAKQESIGTGTGVTTSFGPLTFVPTSEDSIIVYVDGIAEDTANWSYSGGNIMFSIAPAAAQTIYVWYLTSGSSSPLPTPTGVFKVEFRTLSSGEATAKQLTLLNTPASASDVLVDVIGGTSQEYSVDYTISSNVLDWNGLGLDSVPLVAGDKLRVAYIY